MTSFDWQHFSKFPLIEGPFSIGDFRVYLISDGGMLLMGQSMFRTMDQIAASDHHAAEIPHPRERPEGETKHKGRTLIGLNVLYIEHPSFRVLVDTGIGNKGEVSEGRSYIFQKPRLLLDNLSKLGVHPTNITHVINTHLHFDHCGGNTTYNEEKEAIPTFPNATYFISRGEYECALYPPPGERKSIPLINILPLQENNQLELWDHDGELLPGIEVRTTGGHTRNHCIVLIKSSSETGCFLADLIPTSSHIHPNLVMKFDLFPFEVKQSKKQLLEEAAAQNWLLFFDHAPRVKVGHVVKDDHRFVFRPYHTLL
ncbi:MAG: MBL fold metallo-hydrolase [bacterium]|nr:MBL fold metallo-hydrolase [bacterium]